MPIWRSVASRQPPCWAAASESTALLPKPRWLARFRARYRAGDLAAGVVAIADAAMANAIRELTVFRGIDPRSFALMAFGGAGPLHAVALAEELGIGTVIVPLYPGCSRRGACCMPTSGSTDRSHHRSARPARRRRRSRAAATLERELAEVVAAGRIELTRRP